MITIKRVYLKNFVSHKETVIEFDRGVTAIIGPNGAGKSSIVEAIYFALTGEVLRHEGRGRSKGGIINYYAKEGEAVVKLWLEANGEEVYIERRYSRRGTVPYDAVIKFGGRTRVGSSEVRKAVAELLGISEGALKNVVEAVAVVPQGGVTKLLTMLPSKRKEYIDKLLGLEAYEEARKRLEDYVVTVKLKEVAKGSILLNIKKSSVENLRRLYSTALSEVSEAKEELVKVEGGISEASKKAQELRAEESKIREDLKRVRLEIEEVSRKLGEVENLRKKAGELRARLEDLRCRIKDVEAELRRVKEAEEEVKALEPLAKLEPVAKELRELLSKEKELEAMLRSAEAELKEVKTGVDRVKAILATYPEGIEEALRRAEEARGELEEFKAKEESLRKRSESLRAEAARIESQVSNVKVSVERIKREVSETLGREVESVSSGLAALEELAESLSSKLREVEERLEELRNEEGTVNASIKDLERRVEVLMRSGDIGKCPLCEQPLSKEHREKVATRLMSDLRSLRERRSQILKLKEKLRELRDVVRKRLEKIRVVVEVAREVAEKEAQLPELLRRLDAVKVELARVEARAGVVRERVEELITLASKAERVRRDYEELQRLVRGGATEEALRRAKGKVRKLEEELGNVRVRIRELTAKLGREDPLEAINAVEDAVRRLGEVKAVASLGPKLREELRGLLKEREGTEAELAEIEAKLKEVGRLEARIEELKSKEAELERKLKEVSEARAKAEGRVEELERRKEEIQEKLERLKEDIKEIKEAWFKVNVLLWIKDKVLHKDGAPKLLRKALIRSVEYLMKEYLEYFNLSYSDVRVDEDLNITLLTEDAEVGVGRLSGGELVATAIALILALHQAVLGGRLGFLILDEPTTHLDEERRKQLIEIIKNFRGGSIVPQLIVVTHHEEVRDAADAVYEVSKDRYSRVRDVTEEAVAVATA